MRLHRTRRRTTPAHARRTSANSRTHVRARRRTARSLTRNRNESRGTFASVPQRGELRVHFAPRGWPTRGTRRHRRTGMSPEVPWRVSCSTRRSVEQGGAERQTYESPFIECLESAQIRLKEGSLPSLSSSGWARPFPRTGCAPSAHPIILLLVASAASEGRIAGLFACP